MVEHLHSRLPKPPTAVSNRYELPKFLHDVEARGGLSQESLQEIADHIGYFLGIMKRVPVHLIEALPKDRIVATSGGTVVSDVSASPVPGLYTFTSGGYREIVILKKARFRLRHILAILAHESIHNYLQQYDVGLGQPEMNEVLTDVGAAYLGLGDLLLAGYEPIEWVDVQDSWLGQQRNIHSLYLGYLRPRSIRLAIARAAELREMEELAANLGLFLRMRVANSLKKTRGLGREKNAQLDALLQRIARMRAVHASASELLKCLQRDPRIITLSPEEGMKAVEIVNALATGEVELMLERLWMRATQAKEGGHTDDANLADLKTQTDECSERIAGWDAFVGRFIGEAEIRYRIPVQR
jgi:hypothetical protein